MNWILRGGLAFSLAAGYLVADVSYQETVRYTGGALVDMSKSMQGGLMGKMVGAKLGKALQDHTSKVYLKGNKMARVGPTVTSIIDLDAGTMTMIDSERQSYSTITFDELRQQMDQARERMAQHKASGSGDIKFDVKVDPTGQTREIQGQTAKEYIMTLTAQGEQTGGMRVRSDMWTVSSVAGFDELRFFQKKMAEKMGYAMSGFNPMMGAANQGLSELTKEITKLDGYPLAQDTSIAGVQSPMGPMMGGDPNTPFLTTTSESSGFSTESVADSVFQIPAGYKEQKRRGMNHE
jgi:hypothetical protein